MFEHADAVKEIADKLIENYHHDLRGVRVDYLWHDKPIKRNGRLTLGRARKITGLAAFLASGENASEDDQSFFVIEIDKENWPHLLDEEKQALVDHELTHLFVDEDGKLGVLPHDLEEFFSIVKRHGLWSEDLKRFDAYCETYQKDND